MKKGVFYPSISINGEKQGRSLYEREGFISDCGELILHCNLPYDGWRISHVKTGYRCLGAAKDITSKKRGLEILKQLSENGLGLWSQIGDNPIIPEPLKSQLKAIVVDALKIGGVE